MSIFLLLTGILFINDNAEFIRVSNEQLSEGYQWVKVGKSVPSGTPAITIKPENKDAYILYRLEK